MSTLVLISHLNIPLTVAGRYQQQLGRKASDLTCDPDPITLLLLVSLNEFVSWWEVMCSGFQMRF